MSEESQNQLDQTEELENETLDEASGEDQSGEESENSEQEMTEAEIKQELKKIKKLKLKFNGKEFEEELPFEIDDQPEAVEYMKRQLQMAKMGQQKSQDYSMLQKQVGSFLEELKKNPRKALSNPNIGVDLKQLAAEILQEEIENSQKTPDQIEKEQLQAKLKEIEEERTREKEESKRLELERRTNEAYERYDMLMSKALEESDLPKSPYVVKKMADYMIMAVENNIDLSPADIVPIIKDEVLNDFKQMIGVMPAEALQSFLGKDVFDKVRKHNLSKVKKTKSPAVEKKELDVGKVKAEPKKKTEAAPQTFRDFFGI